MTVAWLPGQRPDARHDGVSAGPVAPAGATWTWVPSGTAPLPLPAVGVGFGDLRFLSFGHAIGSHLPPERNCLGTVRAAPYYHDCARSCRAEPGHSDR